MNAKDSFIDKNRKKKPYYRDDFKKRLGAASYQPGICLSSLARENRVSVVNDHVVCPDLDHSECPVFDRHFN